MNEKFDNFIESINLDDYTKQKLKNYFSIYLKDDNTRIETLKKIMQYDDIFQEFKKYLLSEQIEETNTSVRERGFTAYSICKNYPFLLVHTAFVYLAYMRDNQEEADKIENMLKSKELNNTFAAKLYQKEHKKEILRKNIKQTLDLNRAYSDDFLYYYYNFYKYLNNDQLIEKICTILMEQYTENPDIEQEYINVIENNIMDYHVENPVTFNGYDAYKLYTNYPYLFQNNAGYLYATLVFLKNTKEKDINIQNIYKLLEYNLVILKCAIYHGISDDNIHNIENFVFKCNIDYDTKKTILEQLLLIITYENALNPINGNPSIKQRIIYNYYSKDSINELKKATDNIESFDINVLLDKLTSYSNLMIETIRHPYERFDKYMNEYFEYLKNR